jgi:dihydrofolate reductase
MRLLMAVSVDGFLCIGPDDDMTWTGPADKTLFRALTSVGGICAAGSATWRIMPRLEGRQLIPVSRSGYTLHRLEAEHPEAWLIGGPTIAVAALRLGLVTEMHLSVVHSYRLGSGVSVRCLGDLSRPSMQTHFGEDLTHRVYRR